MDIEVGIQDMEVTAGFMEEDDEEGEGASA